MSNVAVDQFGVSQVLLKPVRQTLALGLGVHLEQDLETFVAWSKLAASIRS